jgi:hypothetical protein
VGRRPPTCHPDRSAPGFPATRHSPTPACAAFSMKSRMKFPNATKLDRKSGVAKWRDLLFHHPYQTPRKARRVPQGSPQRKRPPGSWRPFYFVLTESSNRQPLASEHQKPRIRSTGTLEATEVDVLGGYGQKPAHDPRHLEVLVPEWERTGASPGL